MSEFDFLDDLADDVVEPVPLVPEGVPIDARSAILAALSIHGASNATLELLKADFKAAPPLTAESNGMALSLFSMSRIAISDDARNNLTSDRNQAMNLVRSHTEANKIRYLEFPQRPEQLCKFGTVHQNNKNEIRLASGVLRTAASGRLIGVEGEISSKFRPFGDQSAWDILGNVECQDGSGHYSPLLLTSNLKRKEHPTSIVFFSKSHLVSSAIHEVLAKHYMFDPSLKRGETMKFVMDDKKHTFPIKEVDALTLPAKKELAGLYAKIFMPDTSYGEIAAIGEAARAFRSQSPHVSKSIGTAYDGFSVSTDAKQTMVLSAFPGLYVQHLKKDYAFESRKNPFFPGSPDAKTLCTPPVTTATGSGRDHIVFLAGARFETIDIKPPPGQTPRDFFEEVVKPDVFNKLTPAFSDAYLSQPDAQNISGIKGVKGPGEKMSTAIDQTLPILSELYKLVEAEKGPPVIAVKTFSTGAGAVGYQALLNTLMKFTFSYNFYTVAGGKGHNFEIYVVFVKKPVTRPVEPLSGGRKYYRLATTADVKAAKHRDDIIDAHHMGKTYQVIAPDDQDVRNWTGPLSNMPVIYFPEEEGADVEFLSDTYRVDHPFTTSEIHTVLASYARADCIRSVHRIWQEVTSIGVKYNLADISKRFNKGGKLVSELHYHWSLGTDEAGNPIVNKRLIETFKDPITMTSSGDFIRPMADAVVRELEFVTEADPKAGEPGNLSEGECSPSDSDSDDDSDTPVLAEPETA
jgi:hypothetical protein